MKTDYYGKDAQAARASLRTMYQKKGKAELWKRREVDAPLMMSLVSRELSDTITLVEQLCMGIQGSLQLPMWQVGLQM